MMHVGRCRQLCSQGVQTRMQSPMSVWSSERMDPLYEPIDVHSRVCLYDNLFVYIVLASSFVDTM